MQDSMDVMLAIAYSACEDVFHIPGTQAVLQVAAENSRFSSNIRVAIELVGVTNLVFVNYALNKKSYLHDINELAEISDIIINISTWLALVVAGADVLLF